MITIKDFNTPKECYDFAKYMASQHGMTISYHIIKDNLNQISFNPMKSTYYNKRYFGLTPASKKKLESDTFPKEIRFHLREKGESVTYLFEFRPRVECRQTAVLQTKEIFYSYLKKVCIRANVGIIACNLKTVTGEFLSDVNDLVVIPSEPYQIHGDDIERALEKLELNFYMPLTARYLNLKLKRVVA